MPIHLPISRIRQTLSIRAGLALIWVGVGSVTFAATRQDSRPQAPDTFGYGVHYGSPECPFHFIDISDTGTPLTLTASGDDAASDEGGGVLTLLQPFELYGESITDLVVSANGYLAAAASLAKEDGGDFSNDCPLPAIPGNESGAVARIFVYHADLSGNDSGGTIYSQFFTSCPRDSDALTGEACTVVQWHQWGFAFESGTLEAQALLYHQSSQIVIQVGTNDGPDSRATVGLQDREARSTALFACDTPPVAPAGTAVCFLDPRFPLGGPTANLSIVKTNKRNDVVRGERVTYSITVANSGPSPVSNARVTDTPPQALEACSWTCQPMAGSSCTGGPVTGNIDDDAVLLPVGGAVEYTLECLVTVSASGTLTNSAEVTPPGTTIDPDMGNNQATDTSVVVTPPGIFSDDFESGDTDAWS